MEKRQQPFRLSLLEIFLLEFAFWLGLWLLSDYLATLLTLIIAAIVSAVLVIALISEAIEPSRVPRLYFQIMGISVLAPVLAAAVYLTILGGNLAFLR